MNCSNLNMGVITGNLLIDISTELSQKERNKTNFFQIVLMFKIRGKKVVSAIRSSVKVQPQEEKWFQNALWKQQKWNENLNVWWKVNYLSRADFSKGTYPKISSDVQSVVWTFNLFCLALKLYPFKSALCHFRKVYTFEKVSESFLKLMPKATDKAFQFILLGL